MKKFNFLKENIEYLIGTILVLAIISTVVLTQFKSCISFHNTGQIGDTIGGITAPFLNLIGIILLYLTLREQTHTTRIQRDSENVSRLFNIVKTDFESLELYQTNNGCYKGTRAIFEMTELLTKCDDIGECLNAPSVKAFNLSFSFLVSNFTQLLKRNFYAQTDLEDKFEIYSTLLKFKTPIVMVCQASGVYYNRRLEKVGQNGLTDLDKLVPLFATLPNLINAEFKKYAIKSNG